MKKLIWLLISVSTTHYNSSLIFSELKIWIESVQHSCCTEFDLVSVKTTRLLLFCVKKEENAVESDNFVSCGFLIQHTRRK